MGRAPVLINDLILYRSRSGIASYVRELIDHFELVDPQFHFDRLGQTFPGGVLRVSSHWMSGAEATPGTLPVKRRARALVKVLGHGSLNAFTAAAFRLSKWKLYHEPDLIPLSIPARTLVTAHDLSPLLFPNWHPAYRVKKLEKNLKGILDRVELFLADSEATERDLKRLLAVPANRIRVVRLAPRTPFRPSSESRESYLLYVGTIEPRKNIPGMLRAYASLSPEFRRQHPLVLAGGWGWRSEETREMLSRDPWKSTVRYLGFVKDDALVSLVQKARALIYPSFYEGFGLPPLEAMACGTPVVTSHAGALAETAADAAKIIDPGDEVALANAMREIAEDDTLVNELRARGFEHLKSFSWRNTARSTLDAYRSLI